MKNIFFNYKKPVKALLIIAILFFVNTGTSPAQVVTNLGEQIYISAGTDLLINGDIVNKEEGTKIPEIINEGSLILSGNWEGTPYTRYAGQGTFELNGKGTQLLPGLTYYNLLISGSGYKILTNDATVTNSLVIDNGRINTALYRSVITLGPDATISETPTSYVSGYLQTTRNLSKNILYDFGGMGFELKATLQSPGITTLVRATGDSIIQGSFGTQSIKRYFDVLPTNSGDLGAVITFRYWDDDLNGLKESKLALFNSLDNGVTWQNKGFNNRDILNKFLDLPADVSSSRWTLGDESNQIKTGIKETNTNPFTMKIFPNPASEFLVIEENSKRNFTLNLINAQGQVLKQDKFINSTKLNLKDFSAGIYFIQLRDESGIMYNKKFVVLDH
jgi:hypothetical protein